MKKPKRKKAKFRVGQVVRVVGQFKRDQHREHLRIKHVWPWIISHIRTSWGYTMSDGDMVSERFLRPLTKRERGQ